MITNKLIFEIKSKINDNQKQGITGGILQGVLVDMVESLSEAYPQTYTEEQKAQARTNIDALSNHNGEITKEKLSAEVQAILNDVANKQNITDESLATIAKTIVGAINEVYKGGLKDASIATSKIEDRAVTTDKLADTAVTEDKLASFSVTNAKIANASVSEGKIADSSISTAKIKDGAITEPKLDTDLVNVITSAVQPAELASAIATALASYVAKEDIVATTGSATDKVMSQHGVTEAINGVTNQVTELQTQINGKQDALTLTVKDNGNIVIANIQGQSKEFMPATPSGDPMHYAYVASGAVYNDTGADIVKTAPWADLADDDAEKTVVHKNGYWYLNGLGDITNEQMRIIYSYINCYGASYDMSEAFYNANIRTNINLYPLKGGYGVTLTNATFGRSNIEVLNISSFLYSKDISYFLTNTPIKYIIGNLQIQRTSIVTGAFDNCPELRVISLKGLGNSISFSSSHLLSIKSVLYMINNESAKSAITITLHADVYNKCMANADILAALQAHTNISLASA